MYTDSVNFNCNESDPAGTKLELFWGDSRRLNQIIKSELERIKNDPDLQHLIQQQE